MCWFSKTSHFTFRPFKFIILSTICDLFVDIVLINQKVLAMKVDKLTLPFVKTITPPAKKQVFYFDKSFPRFCLCVYPSGRKTFMVKYQNEYGKPRWLKVGTFPIMTLEDARSAASELLHRVDKDKEDPAKTKKDKKNAKTVAELCDWYLEEGVGHKKQSTIKIDRSRIERHIKPLIGDEPIESITRG